MTTADPNGRDLAFRLDGRDHTVPLALIERYNVSGPRYTSYPTYPEWSDDFGYEALVAGIAESNAPDAATGDPSPLSLYVHIPFCKTLCLYCGCNVVISRSEPRYRGYVDTLLRELDLWAASLDGSRKLVQIHWGGGTPTSLAVSELTRLARAITDRFALDDDCEIGLEVDPAVTSLEQIDALHACGFNRLSMGIQDFNPQVLDAVRRHSTGEQAAALIEHARKLGFVSVNTDLMYGLPHQTPASMRSTVRRLIDELAPDRVALFNYAHVPHLKKHQEVLDVDAMPKPEQKLEMFIDAIAAFTDGSRYRFIGLDHFARADDELARAHDDRTLHRNFMGYSTRAGADLFACGNTAISGFNRFYAQNAHDIEAYQKTVDGGRHPVNKGMTCSDEDLLRRDVISRILCHDCVVKSEIEAAWPTALDGGSFDDHFAADLARLATPIDDGLVDATTDHDVLTVTSRGRLLVRNIALCFDEYYHRKGAHRRFSKTV